jgi:hypothetical protein
VVLQSVLKASSHSIRFPGSNRRYSTYFSSFLKIHTRSPEIISYCTGCISGGGKWRVTQSGKGIKVFRDDSLYISRVFLLISSHCIIESMHTVLRFIS